MRPLPLLPRAATLVLVALALLAGLAAGLTRIGWQIDMLPNHFRAVHGPLMISGVLGTLICLERAAALAGTDEQYRWSLLVPLVNGGGTLALLLGSDLLRVAQILLAGGSGGMVVLFIIMIKRHRAAHTLVMAAGAVCWLAGNLLWADGQPVYEVVYWWLAFLILTIVGERLELSRVMRLTPNSQRALLLVIGIYLAGIAGTRVDLNAGVRLSGAGALLMAGWLLLFDLSRRTIRQSGLPRYIAACLMLGYGWLGISGVLALWKGAFFAGPNYDALLHTPLLGFVFSMIFGHAPIILPALTGLQVRFHPALYLHLALLHTSLAYRIYGDLWPDFTARRWGGLLNATAILLFMGMMAWSVYRARSANLHTATPDAG